MMTAGLRLDIARAIRRGGGAGRTEPEEVDEVARYVTLVNWTDQGIRNYKDTTQRAKGFGEMLQGMGARLVDIYWTMGQYDLVGVLEAPDDETVTAAALKLGTLGNVRTTTLRAYTADEFARIIEKAG
jgi:uncharacterized protein with GYD domain